MDSDPWIAWWQLDPLPVQQLVHELQVAGQGVRAAADVLMRQVPTGAGLAVEAQTAACREAAAQARTAADCLVDAAETVRGWLGDFEARRAERAAALGALCRELGRPVDPTPQDVRRAVAALTDGSAPELGPVTSGLLAVAYHRLRAIDDDWQALDGAAARRLAALLVPSAPPVARDPAAAARWWQGLLPVQRQRLVRTAPALLGTLDGLPLSVRDLENRHLLGIPAAGRLEALAAAVHRPGASLLEFDPSGDGTAVVALGDLARSRHVAVLVPGMSNEIDDIGRLVEAATAVLASARPGDGLAVVAWLGYDTPRVSQVASTQLARAGADRLTSFIDSLRITAAHADVTVIGHSYGTLVAGEAAQHGMLADRLIFVGSPGVEAARAADLLPAGQVWAARAHDDPIRAVFGTEVLSRWMLGGPVGLLTLRKLRVDRFGPDPTSRSFGARRFSVAGSQGHSDYFRPGSTSVRNITRIATGRPVDRA
jgi:hypothetical protein